MACRIFLIRHCPRQATESEVMCPRGVITNSLNTGSRHLVADARGRTPRPIRNGPSYRNIIILTERCAVGAGYLELHPPPHGTQYVDFSHYAHVCGKLLIMQIRVLEMSPREKTGGYVQRPLRY